MGTLLLGLVVGSAIGFVMGRRRQTSNTAAVTAAPMRPPVAPSSPGPVVPPLAAPNKKAKKVGLTETDFQPSDDILLKMQQAWEQGGRLDPESDAVVVPPPPPEPSAATPEAAPLPAPTLDPTLDDTMRRVFERLEGTPSGKGTGTMDETPERPAPEAAPSAGTVTEALAELEADGYTDDLRLKNGRVYCPRCGTSHATNEVEVDRVYRFEGPSDPADEAIVLGLTCPSCGSKGTLVSAFGPDAEPELAEAFVYMAAKARHH